MPTTKCADTLLCVSVHNRMMQIDMPYTVRSEPFDKLSERSIGVRKADRTGPSDPFVVSLSNHERPFEADRSAVLRPRLSERSIGVRKADRVNGINTFLKVHEPLKSEGGLP